MVDISVIIVSYNTRELLKECLASIKEHTKEVNYEVIVVDNGSTDGSVEELSKLNKLIKLIKNKENVGYARANNQGMKRAKGRYILLLNSDTKLTDNTIAEMVMWMGEHKDVGITTCALKNKDGTVQGTGGYFPSLLRVFSWMTIQDIPFVDYLIRPFHPMRRKSFLKGTRFYEKERELDWVTGAFFLMQAEVVRDVGLFDEDYFMYVEEVDFCFRAKKEGWKVCYLPKWSVTHYGGASGTEKLSILAEYEGVKRFYKKHYPAWQYPLLRFFLKLGALGRIALFGILEGRNSAKIYAKAFRQA